MCICCDGTDSIKPMSDFTASELAAANLCCLKPSDEWDILPTLDELEDWVRFQYDTFGIDDPDLLAF